MLCKLANVRLSYIAIAKMFLNILQRYLVYMFWKFL